MARIARKGISRRALKPKSRKGNSKGRKRVMRSKIRRVRRTRQCSPGEMNLFTSGVGKRMKTLRELSEYRSENPNSLMMVWIYADWCGHCQVFLKAWKQLVQSVENVTFVIIDGDSKAFKNDGFRGYPRVTGYPTLWLFAKGSSTPVSYRGERRAESIKQTLYEQ